MRSSHADYFNDDEANDYDADVLNESDPIRTGYESVLDWVIQSAEIADGSRVLELGSGTGNLTERVPQCREAIHIQNTPALPDGPVALIKDIEFEDGILEVDIASERFAGIAFRAQDGDHYDKVYFRPFNSGTEKHQNTVQYAVFGNQSLGWRPLRANFPGKFESGADIPVMEWFHAKLVTKGDLSRKRRRLGECLVRGIS